MDSEVKFVLDNSLTSNESNSTSDSALSMPSEPETPIKPTLNQVDSSSTKYILDYLFSLKL